MAFTSGLRDGWVPMTQPRTRAPAPPISGRLGRGVKLGPLASERSRERSHALTAALRRHGHTEKGLSFWSL